MFTNYDLTTPFTLDQRAIWEEHIKTKRLQINIKLKLNGFDFGA